MATFYIRLVTLIIQAVFTGNNLPNSSNITVTDALIDKGCDRLEYVYDSIGNTYLNIIPAGVCHQYAFGSAMWVCDNANTMRQLSWSFNDNCKGEISDSKSVKEFLKRKDPRNISINCCTGNQCPYADIIVYDYDEITDCSDVDRDTGGDINSFESHVQGPYVIDSCDYIDRDSSSILTDRSTKYQCMNGTLMEQVYDGNLYCEGSVDDTNIISDGDCEVSFCNSCSSGKKAQVSNVICGVALDTCGIYQPSMSPTASETTYAPTTISPSNKPSEVPTMYPSKIPTIYDVVRSTTHNSSQSLTSVIAIDDTTMTSSTSSVTRNSQAGLDYMDRVPGVACLMIVIFIML